MRTFKTLAATALLVSAATALAACGSSSGGAAGDANQVAASLSRLIASATAGDTAAGTDGGTASDPGSSATGTLSQVSVRIANMYVDDAGKPGPGLDIYDVALDGEAATPILTDVPYGTISAYVHPHLEGGGTTDSIILEALPTGADPATGSDVAGQVENTTDDGSHPQLTVLLVSQGGGTDDTQPLDEMGAKTYVEKGDINGSDGSNNHAGLDAAPVAPAPPAGKGELLASTDALTGDNVSGHHVYLLIDGSCTAPLNGDVNAPGLPEIFAQTGSAASVFALFPTAAGAHRVSVVSEAGFDTPTCASLTAKQGTSSATLTAGQQTLVFVYGTSLTALHLALAPVQA